MDKNHLWKEIPFVELSPEDKLLVEEARHATTLSYSPYSHFKVGAAVLLENGEIIKGGNQENASYPVGICAERTALATAQNLFPNVPIVALALAARDSKDNLTNEIVTPCGMCRQAIAECEKRYQKHIRVIMSSSDNVIAVDKINDLLPLAFS